MQADACPDMGGTATQDLMLAVEANLLAGFTGTAAPLWHLLYRAVEPPQMLPYRRTRTTWT